MALPHDNLNWIQHGEKIEGTEEPGDPDGVLNRPLNQLLENDVYLSGMVSEFERYPYLLLANDFRRHAGTQESNDLMDVALLDINKSYKIICGRPHHRYLNASTAPWPTMESIYNGSDPVTALCLHSGYSGFLYGQITLNIHDLSVWEEHPGNWRAVFSGFARHHQYSDQPKSGDTRITLYDNGNVWHNFEYTGGSNVWTESGGVVSHLFGVSMGDPNDPPMTIYLRSNHGGLSHVYMCLWIDDGILYLRVRSNRFRNVHQAYFGFRWNSITMTGEEP